MYSAQNQPDKMKNKNFSKNKSKSVLIDLSIYRPGITAKYATQEQKVQWGNQTITAPVTGIQRIQPENEEKRRNIELLPTLVKLVGEDKVKLFTYSELNFERLRISSHYTGTKGDLFRGVPIENIPAAIDRSYFGSMTFSECISKESLIEYCKFLKTFEPTKYSNFAEFQSHFTEFQQANLRNLDRFREICKGLPDKQLPDALHLWTAETNNLDYFLTRDKKFINAMTETKKITLPTHPITLENLFKELNVTELDPLPIADYSFYHLHECD